MERSNRYHLKVVTLIADLQCILSEVKEFVFV